MTEPRELELLRSTCRVNRLGAWRWSIAESRVEWTDVMYELFELPTDTQINLEIAMSLFESESKARLVSAVEECAKSGKPYDEVVVAKLDTGKTFRARASGSAEKDAAGNVIALHGSIQDISQQVKVLEAQSLSVHDLVYALQSMPDGFFLLDDEWRFTFLNKASEPLLRKATEELQGKNIWDEFPEARGQKFEEIYRRVMERGGSETFVEYFEPLDTWFHVSVHRAPKWLVVHFRNVSEEIERAYKLKQSERRFELAASATQDAIFEWDVRTGRLWANDAYKTIYGYDAPAYMPLDALEATSAVKADHHRVREAVLEAINSGKERYAHEYEFTRPDGTFGHVTVRGFIVRDEKGQAQRIIGTATDIAKLSRAIAALEQSEKRFRLIANSASDVLWDHDFESGFSWSSPDWPSKLGVDVDPAKFQDFQWTEILDPYDRDRLVNAFKDVIKSDANEWEIEFRARNSSGEPIDLQQKAAILRRPDGRAYRILGTTRNVTKEKRNQEGYTRSRALEAVGQLTGGVAHDFNNLLMIILGNAEMLEATMLDEDQAESVAMIHQASSSAADLTRRLLSFSRQSQLRAGCVELTNLIPNTVALLRTGIAEKIAIRCDLRPDIWQANVDGNALEQAIINLAVNARDAMPHGGEIVIGAENKTISSDMESDLLDLEPGDYVIISVTDTGHGMPPEVLSRAFEPFFTTKDIGEGSGLGLSTVFGFAKQSGGHATIQSEPGRGTTVRTYLPRFGQEEEQERRLPEAEHARAETGQRILMVEDEPMVRAHVEKLLSKLGYVVTVAADAQEALSLLHDDQAFDLLFTDVIMPGGMSGPQLGEAALRLAPHIKLLYTSGYPAAAFENFGIQDTSNVNFLAKPYRSAQLKEKLATILHHATPSW